MLLASLAPSGCARRAGAARRHGSLARRRCPRRAPAHRLAQTRVGLGPRRDTKQRRARALVARRNWGPQASAGAIPPRPPPPSKLGPQAVLRPPATARPRSPDAAIVVTPESSEAKGQLLRGRLRGTCGHSCSRSDSGSGRRGGACPRPSGSSLDSAWRTMEAAASRAGPPRHGCEVGGTSTAQARVRYGHVEKALVSWIGWKGLPCGLV